jgi:catechol 2,3-dioxygenase-like lactoylglutathione lyase family enzyme
MSPWAGIMTTEHDLDIQVHAIDHITIVVKDLEASASFYTEVLGMREVERPRFGFPGRWFQAGTTQIHMNVEGEEAGRAGIPPLGNKKVTRGFHYAFLVDDCLAVTESLKKAGIPLAAGPQRRPDGATQVYLRDPDGHLIELVSPPPRIPNR